MTYLNHRNQQEVASYLGGRLQVRDKSHLPPGQQLQDLFKIQQQFICLNPPIYLFKFQINYISPLSCREPAALEGRSDRDQQAVRAQPGEPRQHRERRRQPQVAPEEGGRGVRGFGGGEEAVPRAPPHPLHPVIATASDVGMLQG